MQTLEEFLRDDSGRKPKQGQKGKMTDWLAFYSFVLKSGKVCVCDPAFAPPEVDMAVTLDLTAGKYSVEGRGIAFGNDRRVAAIRCVRAGHGKAKRGEVLGEVGVDTGRIGFCDKEVFGAAVAKLGEDGFTELLDATQEHAGVLKVSRGAAFPYVDSGFGDGSYEVVALRAEGELVGFELTLIEKDAAYPFGGDEGSQTKEGKTSEPADETQKFFQEMIARMKETRTGDKAKDRAAFKDVLRQMLQDAEEQVRPQVETYRRHLIAQRQAVPLLWTETRPGNREILNQPEVATRRIALEGAGYRTQGVHEYAGIAGFALVLLTHANGTIASISVGKQLTTELEAEYADGKSFYARDTPEPSGLTPPPWAMYHYLPGLSVAEMIAWFNAHRPVGHISKGEARVVAELANGFNRVQEWRLERGGWNRAEVQAQMKIADANAAEFAEKITDQCINVREKWLFAWFKHEHPHLAKELLETLLIVHDDLDTSVLWFLWVMGGGSMKVRKQEFEGESSRAVFHRINESQGSPMRLVAQKLGGYGADFYAPIDVHPG